jgi:glutaredoxin
MRALLLTFVLVLGSVACSGPDDATSETQPQAGAPLASAGEVIDPPFAVRGEAEGLMITWFDAEGTHVAERRSDVPETARAEVRVDSPSLAPEDRDADHVLVADLRRADESGRYVVRRVPRVAFEDRVRAAREAAVTAVASGEIIVFGASWCGACRQAEGHLRARGVAFEERDIEADPGARQDMIRRARAAGITPNGIPVIDIRGRVLQGFDAQAIDRALAETGGTGGTATTPTPGTPPSGTPAPGGSAAPSGGVTI